MSPLELLLNAAAAPAVTETTTTDAPAAPAVTLDADIAKANKSAKVIFNASRGIDAGWFVAYADCGRKWVGNAQRIDWREVASVKAADADAARSALVDALKAEGFTKFDKVVK